MIKTGTNNPVIPYKEAIPVEWKKARLLYESTVLAYRYASLPVIGSWVARDRELWELGLNVQSLTTSVSSRLIEPSSY